VRYQLRPPELLDLTLKQYHEFTVSDSRAEVLNSTQIRDWKSYGLRDLNGKRVLLHKDLFSSSNLHLAFLIFQRINDTQAVDTIINFLLGANHCTWCRNVVSCNSQPKVFVTPMLSPATKYKWWGQQLLLSEPFDDEEALFSGDLQEELIARGLINCKKPEETLKEFILEDLVYWPLNFKRMWSTLRESWKAILSAVSPDSPEFHNASYPVSDEALTCEHDRVYQDLLKNVENAHEQLFETLPTWARAAGQNPQSWKEQQECTELLLTRLTCVLSETRHHEDIATPRPVYITGPPGCGKTYIAMNAMRQFNDLASDCDRYCEQAEHF